MRCNKRCKKIINRSLKLLQVSFQLFCIEYKLNFLNTHTRRVTCLIMHCSPYQKKYFNSWMGRFTSIFARKNFDSVPEAEIVE